MLRWLALILLLLSAPLGGALPAIAQARDLGAMADSAHHHPTSNMVNHASTGRDGHCVQRSHCPSPAKADHPALCSACVAIHAAPPGFMRSATSSTRLSPQRQAPLLDQAVKPLSPPPKCSLSI